MFPSGNNILISLLKIFPYLSSFHIKRPDSLRKKSRENILLAYKSDLYADCHQYCGVIFGSKVFLQISIMFTPP